MEQELVIVRINETISSKKFYRKSETQRIPLSKLGMGAEIEISEQRKMSVVKLTDEELTFFIDNQRCYTLNRYWQVLGTVKMDICPTLSEKDTERFAFYFETQVDTPDPGVYQRISDIYGTMKENSEDMEIWKNIPLARELMHLLKDCCPLRDEEINPVMRMTIMDAMTQGYLLSENELPRLFLSFYQYWEINKGLKTEEDVEDEDDVEEEEAEEEVDGKSFDSHYGKLFKYSWMIDTSMTGDLYDKLLYNGISLRFDIIQLSPQWEKMLYDIEKETFKKLKGQSRGMGFCYVYWMAKTEIAARYGIHWRSPQVMNPGVRFD